MAVLGFGGADAASSAGNPQMPVDQVCPLTQVNTADKRQSLSDCIGNLRERTYGQGWNTDFISAINQATSDLSTSGDSARPLLMFMLTDGHLDLFGDPAYSGSAQQVQNAAEDNLLNQALPAAKRAGVEIWPLGFGRDVDVSELGKIAAGGAQGSCSNLPGTAPHQITVLGAAQVEQELQAIYAKARCLGLSPGSSASLSGGQSVDLVATVPVIATDGAIEVIRQNPGIQVTFYDPHGHQVPDQGSFDQSTFQLGGADGPVEALTITDPVPGVWRVHLQAPAGMASTAVNASVLWQGMLRSDIVVVPPEPRAGQRVTVSVRLQVRGEVLVDPAALAGVTVRAQMSGAGFAAPAPVSLADNGQAPDAKAGDGVYSGYLTVPATASGSLQFAGAVTGQGVTGDERHFSTSIVAPLSVSAQLTLPAGTVAPGGTSTGSVTLGNSTGAAHTIRLILQDAPPGLTVSPSTFTLSAASGTVVRHFTMGFKAYTPHGPVKGTLEAVDAASPGQVYAATFIGVTVAVPPPWWQRYWWAWALLALALLAAITAAARSVRAAQRRRSMEDVEMVLYEGGREIDSLQAPVGCGSRFEFSIDTSRTGLSRLEAGGNGMSDYVARRRADGLVLTAAGGEPILLAHDVPATLEHGGALGFRDLRLNDALALVPEWTGETEDPDADTWEDQRRRRPRRRRHRRPEPDGADLP